jgi:hypothetical protein
MSKRDSQRRKSNKNQNRQACAENTWRDDLASYAIAAGAAGVGLLALAVPAEASIVYTPIHTQIPAQFEQGKWVRIDIDGDGVADYRLSNFIVGDEGWVNVFTDVRGNQVIGTGNSAFALQSGASIGPAAAFQRASASMEHWNDFSGFFQSYGLWKNTANGYLGLKFLINGEYHFGWARLSVKGTRVALKGYAYETIPNKPILAGQTEELATSSVDQEIGPVHHERELPMLGLLARGASGLVAWRRTELDSDVQR